MAVKVFIADDHDCVIDYFKLWFTAEEGFDWVGCTQDGLKVLKEVRRTRPDVLVLDVVMTGMHGLDILRELTKAKSSPRVLMFSGYWEMRHAAEARRLGAHGFVTKGQSLSTLTTAVRAVAAGDHYYGVELSASLEQYEAWADQAARRPAETLTPTERKVLYLYGQGKTALEIAGLLYSAPRTIERHLSSGTHKLRLPPAEDLRRRLVHQALGPEPAAWMRPMGPQPP